MKITNKKIKINHKKIIVIIIAAIIVLIAILSIFSLVTKKATTSVPDTTNSERINVINLSTPTNEERNAGQTTKKDTINSNNSSDPSNEPVSVSLHGIKNGDQIVFDTLIQAVSSIGQCELSITSNSKTIVKTADIFANPSTSICKGFSVQVSELPIGIWKAELRVTIGDRFGSDSTEVIVEP